ncbi:MAG: methyl-accepting chemotaxis protein [Polyangiaceae bacterium]
MGDDISTLRIDLGQVRSLLADAITTLQRSFYELVAKTSAHRDLALSLLGEGATSQANHGMRNLVDEVAEVMRRLVGDLKAGSDLDIQVAERMERLITQLEGTFTLISKLDGIATQTNILSINAYIEAARSGDRGKAFGVVASEVRALSKASRELNDAMADRVQEARGVLLDMKSSVEGLGARGAAAAKDARDRGDVMLHRLGDFDQSLHEHLAALHQAAADIDERANAAVRALQFEDMVRQVLESCDKRLDRMQSVVDHMEFDPRQAASVLEGVHAVAAAQIHSPVAQDSMIGGDIELF